MKLTSIIAAVLYMALASQGQADVEYKMRVHDPEYRILPGDLLALEIFNEPDLRKYLKVESDGTTMLPLIRKINIGGLTATEAQEYIQVLYNADYLVAAEVSLSLVEFEPQRVQISAQSTHTWPVEIPLREEITLEEAIEAASGLNREKREPSPYQDIDIEQVINMS